MTSYVDIDTSEEALREDVEIREAVEQMVAKGAEAIITDVKNDFSGFYELITYYFYLVFPFVVDWKEDRDVFWRDLEHCAIALALFIVFFTLLAPWEASKVRRTSSWLNLQGILGISSNGRNKQTGNSEVVQQSSCLHLTRFDYWRKLSPFHSNVKSVKRQTQLMERSKSTSSILGIDSTYHKGNNNAPILQNESEESDEEESEEEKFLKRWPAILETEYRCLVLPPSCKRVEKPKLSHRSLPNSSTSNKQQPDGSNDQGVSGRGVGLSGGLSTTSENHDENSRPRSGEDNPATRLMNYIRHLFHLIMLFRRYDYVGAGWTLINWIQAALRARKSNRAGQPSDDEDDESVTSGSMISTDHDDMTSTTSSSTTAKHRSRRHGGKRNLVKPNRAKEPSPRGVRGKTERSHRIRDALPMPLIVDHEESKKTEEPNTISTGRDGKEYSSSDALGNHDSVSLRVRTGSWGRADEEKKDTLAYDRDETLTKTPPRASLGSQTPPYHTPQRETQLPVLDLSSASSSESSATAFGSLKDLQTPTSSNASPSSSKLQPMTAAHKTRDALENYRLNSSRRLGHVATSSLLTSSVNATSNHETSVQPGIIPLALRAKVERVDTRNPFYFEAATTQESIRRMAVEVPVPDRNGFIVGDDFLPDSNFTPLLVFVNSRSGPQQGHLLITQLRGLLNPIQVWDLADGGPENILESFSVFSRLRILVCGGDGTVSWIVSTIEKMKLQRWPPIAILPLGTGNDLARIHGWGGGYNNESLLKILEQVAEGYISWLDRWEMTIENKKGKVKEVKSFFNYLGVGADAQAALQVHMLREFRPQLFFSRLVNKAWYGIFGAEDIIKATSVNLPYDITLIADGVEVPLPADSQGIILLNIDSYAGGVPLWSLGHHKAAESDPVSLVDDDGLKPLKRSKSLDALRVIKKRQSAQATLSSMANHSFSIPEVSSKGSSLERIDSVEDISSLALTDEEKYARVTACDRPSSCQDGLLDIVSIRGAFHLGQIRVGLSTAQKLCQCREATIIVGRKVSVQIDGEPWRQNVCTLRVRRKKDAAIMLHRSADESNGVETEMAKLLDWAEERHLIDTKVHAALMKEFSRRIESKTRQRRVRSKDNLMFSLQRAMNVGNTRSQQSSHATAVGTGNSAGIIF